MHDLLPLDVSRRTVFMLNKKVKKQNQTYQIL